MYRGIVNAHLHNGLKLRDRDYECGFVYGGIFALGYCQFIHDYMQQHRIEKLLFLARDGDILSQVYRLLYPEEDAAGKAHPPRKPIFCKEGKEIYETDET